MSKIIQLKSINNFSQRIPFFANNKTALFINTEEMKKMPVFYSTFCYITDNDYDINNIPSPRNKDNPNKIKVTDFCCQNFKILPNFVIDFDCDHIQINKEDNQQKHELLVKLTEEIKIFAYHLIEAGLEINKDFFLSYSGNKGFHFQIPLEVLGIEPFEPGNVNRINKTMRELAHTIIANYSENKEFLDRCIDDSIYSKDRIFRAINSYHPISCLYTYLLTENDLSESCSIEEIKEKAKVPNIIDIPEVTAMKNTTLSELYNRALINNTNNDNQYNSEPINNSCYHTENYFPCHCVELQAKYGFEKTTRFEDNMVFVICAYNYGGETAVKNFYRRYAKTKNYADPEKKAEEWTAEVISTLQGRVHSCNTIQSDGRTIQGTYDVIIQYIRNSGLAHIKKFECNTNCPYLTSNTELSMNERIANRWADKYIKDKKIINIEQTLYKFTGAFYERIEEDEIKRDISAFLGGRYNRRWRDNIWLRIQDNSIIKKEKFQSVEDEICLNNGVLNLKTFKISPHSESKLFFNKFDVNYYPEKTAPESELLDHFIDNLFPGSDHIEKKELLLKYVGYMFTPGTEYQVACLMTSDGNSGKSTFANILAGVFGEENWVNISSINDISDKQLAERYKNKRAIYIDEIGTKELMDDGKLKSVISGGEISFNSKWKRPGSFKNSAKFLLGTNNQGFLTRDYSGGFCRRFIVIKFPANFTKNKSFQILDIDKKILSDQNAKDRLFYIAMESLKTLRKDGKFQMSDRLQNEIFGEIMSNNNVLEFIKSHLFYSEPSTSPLCDSIDRHEVWKYYSEWAKEKGHKPYSDRNFWREVKRHIKCSIDEGGPHYKKSNGRVWLKNIAVKGLSLIITEQYNSSKVSGVKFIDIENYDNCLSLADGSYDDYITLLKNNANAQAESISAADFAEHFKLN